MSSSLEIYEKIFTDVFSVSNDSLEKLEYNQIDQWDSIGHMTLVSELEDKFKISMETDDIIDLSSFKKGKEILKKYKVSI
tara:strand:- start:2633 stop:2872 length:240 start_codon:yes stop_codon:yes gene_type:complete